MPQDPPDPAEPRDERPDADVPDAEPPGDQASDDTVALPEATGWAGRAQIPVPSVRGPAPVEEQADWDGEWRAEPIAPPASTWWLPVVLAALALVLLGALAVGLWLISQAISGDPAPAGPSGSPTERTPTATATADQPPPPPPAGPPPPPAPVPPSPSAPPAPPPPATSPPESPSPSPPAADSLLDRLLRDRSLGRR